MTEVIKTLQLEDVFYYHDLVITSTGGDSGVRDRGLVESAYCSAFQTIPLYIVPRLFPFGRASLALPSIRRGSALLASLNTRKHPHNCQNTMSRITVIRLFRYIIFPLKDAMPPNTRPSPRPHGLRPKAPLHFLMDAIFCVKKSPPNT